jgi:hypothetical protein
VVTNKKYEKYRFKGGLTYAQFYDELIVTLNDQALGFLRGGKIDFAIKVFL